MNATYLFYTQSDSCRISVCLFDAYSHLLHIKRDGFISEKSFYMSAGHHFRSRQRVHLRIIYEHDGVCLLYTSSRDCTSVSDTLYLSQSFSMNVLILQRYLSSADNETIFQINSENIESG